MSRYNIKVIGVGGGGSNTIDYLIDHGVENIHTYSVNTDAQALEFSKAGTKIHIGEISTKGLGAGALPEVGRIAAEESKEKLVECIQGASIVFVAAGMGGGTGTGAAPYVASIAKQMGILTIGIVTKPFKFEGGSRMKMALDGLKELNDATDITIVIPNEKLVTNHRQLLMEDAFSLPDEVLKTSIEAIILMLETTATFMSNIDLNTLRANIENKGLAVIGIGKSSDLDMSPMENCITAVKNAISSEILEISIHGARKAMILITCNVMSFSIGEIDSITEFLTSELGHHVECLISIRNEESYEEFQREVAIIATGYEDQEFVGQIIEQKPKKIDDNLFVGL